MPPDDSTLPGFDDTLAPARPSLIPVNGREQPAIWVAKLAVYKSWPPSPASRLRVVELRRGLNIIWARPDGANAAARRLGGHGAGKTTFCRLLRYALGDGSAGNRVANLRTASNLAVRAAQQQGETDLLLTEVANRQAEWRLAKAWIEEIEEAVDLEDKRLRGIVPSPPKAKAMDDMARQMISGLNPFRGVCSHPMDKAWRAQCPIAHERPAEDDVQAAVKGIVAGSQSVRTELEKLRAELARREAIGAPKKAAVDSATALLDAARKRQAQELERLQEPARQAASLESMLKAYQRACADLDKLGAEIKSLDQEKRDLDAQLTALTKHHRKLIEQFTALFHHVARQMLGEAVNGSVGFSGKSIEPRLEYHGPRDSAALKVTKWLAFDLAAVALGIAASEANHPRFMLHDSPRESDLAPEIYGGLFAAARELEGTFGESAPFQYVVTTTQPPPASVNGAPWMRLELDASVESGRFLGIDL